MTALALRLVFSLAIVVGLLLLLTRFAGRRFQGKTGAVIQVVHRQQLSRGTGVAVITVGERVLVLGTTEQQVTLLTELEPDELLLDDDLGELDELFEHDLEHAQAAEEPRARTVLAHRAATPQTKDGSLAGSVLSAETWRQALKVARGTARDAS
ncbi:MAG: flagellar biosynthetic protein FliO [Nocardioides sp.]